MKAAERAVVLLAQREHSVKELQAKLSARGYEKEEIDQAIIHLQSQNLQSDSRFAEAYVRSRLARGEGPLKIKAGLINRGIADELVLSSLSSGAVDWVCLAIQGLEKKFRSGPHRANKLKQQRFLRDKGFNAEVIRQACAAFE